MTARHANTLVAAAQSQPPYSPTTSPRSSPRTIVRPNRTATAPAPQQPLSVVVARLEATYPTHKFQSPTDIPIGETECQKRVLAYSCAFLYPKGHHLADTIQKNTCGDGLKAGPRSQTLWVGRKWGEILKLFDDIVTKMDKSSPTFKPLGLMFLLRNGYYWYRAGDDARCTALTRLCSKTDLIERVTLLGGLVAEQINKTREEHMFIMDDRATRLMGPSLCSSNDREAAAKGFSSSGLPREISGDGKLVLNLLCMLSTRPFSTTLLLSGATPRKRWTEQGHIGEAGCDGLSSALHAVLSNSVRLQGAIDELENASALTKSSDGSYTVDAATRSRTLSPLLPEGIQYWRRQAFLVVCHAVPWKYLEVSSSEEREILMPHLEFTLEACRTHNDFSAMTSSMSRGIALTLLEASRFPGKQWKQLAAACAKEITQRIDDPYINICIAQRECLLHRLAGKQQDAVDVLDNPFRGSKQQQQQQQHGGEMELIMHAAAGHSAVQRAMNFFQHEKLAAAIEALDSWQPLHRTAAEEAVRCRMSILRARILRFQGRFTESLACLERQMERSSKGLLFNEDLPDLICELADTLRELDEPLRAEQLLRDELARGSREHRASSKNLLQLCLAESLYAQGRFPESLVECHNVERRHGLVKMERLRLFITLAKLRHIDEKWVEAFDYWTRALLVLNSFPPTSGLATRTIYLSTCDILRRQGQGELELATRAKVMTLEGLCQESEAKHWIAGLRHWLAFLEDTQNT